MCSPTCSPVCWLSKLNLLVFRWTFSFLEILDSILKSSQHYSFLSPRLTGQILRPHSMQTYGCQGPFRSLDLGSPTSARDPGPYMEQQGLKPIWEMICICLNNGRTEWVIIAVVSRKPGRSPLLQMPATIERLTSVSFLLNTHNYTCWGGRGLRNHFISKGDGLHHLFLLGLP